MKRFRVDLIADAQVTCQVEVEADTAEEAQMIAPSHASDWQLDGHPTSIGVVNVEDEEEFT